MVKFDTGQTWLVVKFDHWSNSKLVNFKTGQIWPLVTLLSGQIRSVPGLRVFEQTGQIRRWSNLTSGQIWPLSKFQTGQIPNWSNLTTGQTPNWSNLLSPGFWWFSQVVKYQSGQIWPVVKFQTGQIPNWSNFKLVKFSRGSRPPSKRIATPLYGVVTVL